ncbi:MAG TPA: DNA polymerase I [Dongiaceae bacterium]|jgi:DNA polymerase-1|nr:DNA polymerase I [Dongiaceae bacterium]
MADSDKTPDHYYLVDGSGYIFRAFHALPPMTRPDGTPVNAVYGFTNMLLKLIDDADAEFIAVIFDAGSKSFRNDLYAGYKAQRPPPPPELIPQFGLIRDATRACNVPAVELAGFEADDLLATYARQAAAAGHKVTIVSSDKDLMQLVGGSIEMLDPIKNRRIGDAEVMEKFGVAPDKVVDVQSLAGDSTDNVPGVPGIGVKTAAELINIYGDLDTLLARAGEIKQPKRREALMANADKARLSRDLVRLRQDVPVPVSLDTFARRRPDAAVLLPFLKENQFRSILARMEERFGAAAAAAQPGSPSPAPFSLGAEARPINPRPAKTPSGALGEVVAGDASGYVLVQDLADLDRWIAEARLAGSLAFDTETTSLDPMQAELVGFSLAIKPGKACYVPVGHRAAGGDLLTESAPPPRQIARAEALARIKPLLEDDSVLKICQNVKYDIQVMARLGITIAGHDDTMMISYVLEGGAHGHGMDELAERHLGQKTISYGEVTGSGKAKITFDRVALDKARDYAAEDADVTLKLYAALKPRLAAEKLLTVYETIERPLIPVVARMEMAGIKVDANELRRLSADFGRRLADLEREIHKLAGHEFNIGSPMQLGKVLFDSLGLGGGKKGKTGAYATGADVLEELAAQGHELPARVMDWRQLSKLKSTYADSLVEQINPETGRVHTSFAMAATSTGRLSSNDPNLQNIPVRTEEGRKIRGTFIAEKGHKLLSVDYSQIELRLAAHMADVAALKEAFRDGVDIHAMTASQVFNVPVEGMDPMVRRKAKAINFGIIYGISGFGLAQQLGIAQGEAKAYIDAYFAKYPGIRAYMDRTKADARAQGYVSTIFGRRCHVPGINDKNPARRSFMERAAINAPIQGSAADIIKRAMIRIDPALDAANLKARMLLQVHDELLFEVPEAEVEATSAVVKKVMEGAAGPALELSVPLVADVGVGDNWAAAH